jgi:hypothetical protein
MVSLPTFPVEGGCICGATRYQLNALPLGVYACHCKDCQRQSGTGFTQSMFVRKHDFAVIKGETMIFDKHADSGRVVRQHTCPVCHTRLYNEPLSAPDYIVLRPGTLDDASWAAPVGNIWTDSRAPWVEIDWDLPHFPGQAPSRDTLFKAWRVHWGLEG